MVVCPICNRAILDSEDENPKLHTCPHVLVWFNSVCNRIVYAKRQMKQYVKSYSGNEKSLFKSMDGNNAIIIHKYKGKVADAGGFPVFDPVDLIAFKKGDK